MVEMFDAPKCEESVRLKLQTDLVTFFVTRESEEGVSVSNHFRPIGLNYIVSPIVHQNIGCGAFFFCICSE